MDSNSDDNISHFNIQLLVLLQIAIILLAMIGTIVLALIIILEPNWLLHNLPKQFPSVETFQDPAMWLFPFTVYVSYGTSLVFILVSIYIRLQVKHNRKFRNKYSEKPTIKFFVEFSDWKEKGTFTLSVRIVWYILIVMWSILTTVYLFVGAASPVLFLSPVVTFYFTLLLSILLIWLSIGVKSDSIKKRVWLLLILIINIIVLLGVAFVEFKPRFLAIALSYQIFTLLTLIFLVISSLVSKKR